MRKMTITLPDQDDKIGTYLTEPDREMFDELKEQYNFNSNAEAARSFLLMGMRSVVDNDPRHSTPSQAGDGFSPVTIRQLVPEGPENAVDMTDEFWTQILRDELVDIVGDDPEINRDGYEIYR